MKQGKINAIFGPLTLSLILGFSAPVKAALNPTFLILEPGENIVTVSQTLMRQGAHVKSKLPPRIVVADLPASIDPSALSYVSRFYRGSIPLNDLNSYGPLAIAAGLQWNRTMVHESKAAGAKSFGAMKASVGKSSLPGPQNLSATPGLHRLSCQWDVLYGALGYEVQLASDEGFQTITAQTITAAKSAELPLPSGTGSSPFYLRVRGLDQAQESDANSQLVGSWSQALLVSAVLNNQNENLTAPQLTSPLENYESSGFTLILEWVEGASSEFRVQVSKSDTFADTVVDTRVTKGEFVVPLAALHLGETYHWRVKSWSNSTSPYSASRSFKVGPPHHVGADMFINPEAPR